MSEIVYRKSANSLSCYFSVHCDRLADLGFQEIGCHFEPQLHALLGNELEIVGLTYCDGLLRRLDSCLRVCQSPSIFCKGAPSNRFTILEEGDRGVGIVGADVHETETISSTGLQCERTGLGKAI